jgi:hypothetical protein
MFTIKSIITLLTRIFVKQNKRFPKGLEGVDIRLKAKEIYDVGKSQGYKGGISENQLKQFLAFEKQQKGPKVTDEQLKAGIKKSMDEAEMVKGPDFTVEELTEGLVKDVPEWTKGWTPKVIKGGKDDTIKGIMNTIKGRVERMKNIVKEEKAFKDEMKAFDEAKKKPKMGKINYKEMEKKLKVKLRGDETWEELLALEKEGKDFAFGGVAGQLHLNRPGYFAAGPVGKGLIGGFTKAEVLIQMLKNTLKGSKDPYVKKIFPNFIKELQKNPKLALDENVWKQFTTGLPKNQRLIVHSDDSVDFFTQSEFGPHNIQKTLDFQKKHNLSREQANTILRMEPEDRVLEMKRLETIADRSRTKQAAGGRVSYTKGGLAHVLGV